MIITRAWAMPSPNTFSIQPIKDLLGRYIRPSMVVVDAFARNSRLAGEYSNDLNPATDAEFHMDGVAFLQMLAIDSVRADVILIDPPYSPRQISECYKQVGREVGMAETQNARLYKDVKDAADFLVKEGGIVICCGWNSAGMGISRGYQLQEILLVAHGGAHNDTIVTVEKRVAERQLALVI
jgi:hypothetical protein